MKSPLRNLVVDEQSYVYRHTGGPCFILYLSPKNDKNTRLTLLFEAEPPQELPHGSWAFYEVEAEKEQEPVVIHLGRPRFAAEILQYIQRHRPELWQSGRSNRVEDAWTLLRELGYSELQPVWKAEF